MSLRVTKYVLLNPSTLSWRRSLSYHIESIRLKKRKLALMIKTIFFYVEKKYIVFILSYILY